MIKQVATFPVWVCNRCLHTWVGKSDVSPKSCPKCRNKYWDKERKGYWKAVKEVGGPAEKVKVVEVVEEVIPEVAAGSLVHVQVQDLCIEVEKDNLDMEKIDVDKVVEVDMNKENVRVTWRSGKCPRHGSFAMGGKWLCCGK